MLAPREFPIRAPGLSRQFVRPVAESFPCPVRAAVTALSASGLADEHFLFYGFLPAKGGQRRQALQALRDYPFALVFYEAPHRILDTVADLEAVFGGGRW